MHTGLLNWVSIRLTQAVIAAATARWHITTIHRQKIAGAVPSPWGKRERSVGTMDIAIIIPGNAHAVSETSKGA
jgi:hypothetical protein